MAAKETGLSFMAIPESLLPLTPAEEEFWKAWLENLGYWAADTRPSDADDFPRSRIRSEVLVALISLKMQRFRGNRRSISGVFFTGRCDIHGLNEAPMLWLKNCAFDSTVFLGHSHFFSLVFENCTFAELSARGLKVTETATLKDCTFADEADISAAVLDGGLEIDQCRFDRGLTATSLAAARDVIITDTVIKGPLDLYNARIEGGPAYHGLRNRY